MSKVEVLDELFGAREDLELRIVLLHPTNAEQQSLLSKLVNRRDRVTGGINAIIAATFASVASPALLQAIDELKSRASHLSALAKTFDAINDVLVTVDQVLALVAQVVTLAA